MKFQNLAYTVQKLCFASKSVTGGHTHGRTDGRTHVPEAICPSNFFEVGGIMTVEKQKRTKRVPSPTCGKCVIISLLGETITQILEPREFCGSVQQNKYHFCLIRVTTHILHQPSHGNMPLPHTRTAKIQIRSQPTCVIAVHTDQGISCAFTISLDIIEHIDRDGPDQTVYVCRLNWASQFT